MKNILLVDDHEIVRLGVRSVLLNKFSPCTVFEADDEKSALSNLKSQVFDLIILDVYVPSMDTFGLMEYIKNHFPGTRVLIFSMSGENIYAKKFLRAGAMGFVSKSTGLTELQKAIEIVLNNRKYISSELASQLVDFGNEVVNPFHLLSARELEISALMVAGKTVTDISRILGISTSTVGTHKARVLEKLEVNNVVELSEISRQYNV